MAPWSSSAPGGTGHCRVLSQGNIKGIPWVVTPTSPSAINPGSFTDFCEGQGFSGEKNVNVMVSFEDRDSSGDAGRA